MTAAVSRNTPGSVFYGAGWQNIVILAAQSGFYRCFHENFQTSPNLCFSLDLRQLRPGAINFGFHRSESRHGQRGGFHVQADSGNSRQPVFLLRTGFSGIPDPGLLDRYPGAEWLRYRTRGRRYSFFMVGQLGQRQPGHRPGIGCGWHSPRLPIAWCCLSPAHDRRRAGTW